jgi:hypothetical protein
MAHSRTTKKTKLPSMAWLARQADPLQNLDLLFERLKLETSESRYLEWKSTPPIGANVNLRTKYRMVKAVVSFANTEGGFVLFGIGPRGEWLGFTEVELKECDPAALAELINGSLSPEITGINYSHIKCKDRIFPILHVPPSPLVPHVTTKEISERLPDGKVAIHLNKHAVYCRYVAKSDLATPAQYARIITQRTDFLKMEMLRRVKEIPVANFASVSKSASAAPTMLRVIKSGNDASLPAVRITRNPSEAAGVVVTEELSDGIFDEINNVLDANTLLAKQRREFVFGQEIYYRVYAERQHVRSIPEHYRILNHAGALKFYGPVFYWLLKVSPEQIADVIQKILTHDKATNNRIVCRLAILLGPKVTSWLKAFLDHHWKNHAQPPEHYFFFKKLIKKADGADRLLAALQESPTAELTFGNAQTVYIGELLKSPHQASVCLSQACMSVFTGDMSQRSVCRKLDLLAYGPEFGQMEESVLAALNRVPMK